jgi:hypothetical protein
MPDAGVPTLFGAATVIPDAVERSIIASARDQLTGWRRYVLLDRGSYDVIDNATDTLLSYSIVDLVKRVTGRKLATVEARALRLRAGDYILAHADRLHDDNPVEVVVDLSPVPVDAEVHYRRRGQTFLRVPCVPGTASVVERGPTVTCNHTYVSKRYEDACVIRIVALLK